MVDIACYILKTNLISVSLFVLFSTSACCLAAEEEQVKQQAINDNATAQDNQSMTNYRFNEIQKKLNNLSKRYEEQANIINDLKTELIIEKKSNNNEIDIPKELSRSSIIINLEKQVEGLEKTHNTLISISSDQTSKMQTWFSWCSGILTGVAVIMAVIGLFFQLSYNKQRRELLENLAKEMVGKTPLTKEVTKDLLKNEDFMNIMDSIIDDQIQTHNEICKRDRESDGFSDYPWEE